MQGDPFVAGIADTGHDVGRGARADHSQRPDLVDATVARVELEEYVIATDLPRDQSAQVVLDACSLLIELAHRATLIGDPRK